MMTMTIFNDPFFYFTWLGIGGWLWSQSNFRKMRDICNDAIATAKEAAELLKQYRETYTALQEAHTTLQEQNVLLKQLADIKDHYAS
jgi:hypothetical protein